MEQIVQSYLTKHFEIGTSEVGNDGIYSLADKREIRPPIYGNVLLKELISIFSISEDDGKNFVNNWAVSIKSNIDLEFYWSTVEDIFNNILPIVQRVAARTIGLDLVSVKPFDGPTGNLLYFDVNYSGDVNNNGRIQQYEVAENNALERWENIFRIYENQQIFGELDHPTDL